jgi:cation:H+ antiporter
VASALVFWWLSRNGVVSRIEGLTLLGLFGLLLALVAARLRHAPAALRQQLETHAATRSEHWRSALRLLIGIAALIYGARYLLQSVQSLAGAGGHGATLATLALSLPLLGVAWFAAFRGLGQVALGLVLGSSLFQLLALGGVLAATQVLPVPDSALRIDLAATVLLSVLALVLLSGNGMPARAKGAVLVLAYVAALGTGIWLASA